MDSRLLERVYRRVQMLFGRGRVTLVNDAGPIQTMQLKMSDMETCDNRLRMAEFGFTSYPPVGSDAVVAHIAGDRGSGVVVATNHQQSRPTGLQSGESMLYSEDGKHVYITADGGIVVEAKGQDVVVNDAANVTCNASATMTINAPNIVLNGNVQINGNIGQKGPGGSEGTAEFTAPITAPDLILPNGAVNGHNHGNVQNGGGVTDPMQN
jgi:phage baseplate assembly protein V